MKKTTEQIEARVALLKATMDAPPPGTRRRSNTALVALGAAQDALAWVLGDNDADAVWSLQRRLDGEAARLEASFDRLNAAHPDGNPDD